MEQSKIIVYPDLQQLHESTKLYSSHYCTPFNSLNFALTILDMVWGMEQWLLDAV